MFKIMDSSSFLDAIKNLSLDDFVSIVEGTFISSIRIGLIEQQQELLSNIKERFDLVVKENNLFEELYKKHFGDKKDHHSDWKQAFLGEYYYRKGALELALNEENGAQMFLTKSSNEHEHFDAKNLLISLQRKANNKVAENSELSPQIPNLVQHSSIFSNDNTTEDVEMNDVEGELYSIQGSILNFKGLCEELNLSSKFAEIADNLLVKIEELEDKKFTLKFNENYDPLLDSNDINNDNYESNRDRVMDSLNDIVNDYNAIRNKFEIPSEVDSQIKALIQELKDGIDETQSWAPFTY